MDSTITHNHFQLKKNVPELRSGDRVKVHQKIQEGGKTRTQIFEGLVIKTQHGRGINGTFTVRRISLGVGVEKTFPLHMPAITKIEKLKSAKVRRAKLYYVRGLIGKKAKRLKREKESKEVWEDIVVEGDKAGRPAELGMAGPKEEAEAQEQEAEEKSEDTAEKADIDKKESDKEEVNLEKPEKETKKEPKDSTK